MKNSIKRIISFALMLSLLVGMMAGFSVFAAETETVEIVSKNVYFGDTLNLMYEVNSTSDDVVVNVYNANNELVETITEYTVDAEKNGTDGKVFVSKIGVPAQDIDTEFYAQAVVGETKSAMVKYSVLEYLYERLYVSEGATEAQTTMYNSLLAYADAADVVVNEDTTANIAKYAYVRVTNGTVDGTNTAAMVLAGTALDKITTTVTPGTGMKLAWNVTVDNVTKTVENVAEYVTEAGKAYTFTAIEVKNEDYVEEETFVNVTASVIIDEYAAANGWVNGTQYTKVDVNALVTAVAGFDTSASNKNTGKFYDKGRNWRFYMTDSGTLTISAGNYNIVSVVVTFDIEKTGTLNLDGNMVTSGTVVNVGAPSVTFTIGDSNTEDGNGNVQITGIEVVYQVPAHNCEYSKATCTTPATCPICGATNGAALGHAYNEGVETTAPDCTTNGVKTFTCTACSVTKTEVIPFTGHTTENGTCDNCGEQIGGSNVGALENATLSFASTAQRVSQTATEQIWEQNGVKVTNKKGSSTSNIVDYSNPARFYKNSSLTVEGAGIKVIVFDCNSGSYATALKDSIGTVSGATVTVSDDKVTVTFATAVDSFTIEKLSGGQVRMDSITVN